MDKKVQKTQDLLQKPQESKLVANMRAIKNKIMVMSEKGESEKAPLQPILLPSLPGRDSK